MYKAQVFHDCSSKKISKYLPNDEGVGSASGTRLGFNLEWLCALGRIVRERDRRVLSLLVLGDSYRGFRSTIGAVNRSRRLGLEKGEQVDDERR